MAKTDVPSADLSAGDDSLILLADRRSNGFNSSGARRESGCRANECDGVRLRWLEGVDAVSQVVQAGRTLLSRIDLLNNRAKWTLSFPAETQFVRMDGADTWRPNPMAPITCWMPTGGPSSRRNACCR